MCVVALTLTILGGAFQFAGLLVTFAELSAIRAHEWNRRTPWEQLAVWSRQVWHSSRRAARRVYEHLTGRRDAMVNPTSGQIRAHGTTASVSVGTLTDAPPPSHATDAEWIRWLRRYVERHDSELKNVWASLTHVEQKTAAAAQAGDDAVRQEQIQRDRQRKLALRWSLVRQAVASFCVLAGVTLTTIGAVIALNAPGK